MSNTKTTYFRPELFDTVSSNRGGYQGIITAVQTFSYGKVFEVTRTDNGQPAYLKAEELTVERKHIPRNTGNCKVEISDDTARRFRNWANV